MEQKSSLILSAQTSDVLNNLWNVCQIQLC